MSSPADPESTLNENLSVGSDSDLSDGGSDSDQDERRVLEKQARIEELKTEVGKNPYQYQHHSEIIGLYRELGLYNELKQARETMRTLFPLDQTLWLDWLKDEAQLASCQDEQQALIGLADAAVEDYLAIPIWEFYLDLLVEGFTDGLSLDTARDRMQKAVLATQYHYGEGHAIWAKVLQFEEHLLEAAPSDAQKKRVLALYSARLLVPHNELEDTFSRFSSFVSSHLPQEDYEGTMKAANADYSESLRVSLELGPYEDYLKTYSYTWEAYHAYIEFLKSQPESKRNKGVWLQLTKTLYERAAAHHPTNPALWISYHAFLVTSFPMAEVVAKVARRGMRNCPWSGGLVVFYLRSLEASGIDHVQAGADEALAAKMLHSNVEELALVLLELCSISQRLLSHSEQDQLQRLRGILRKSVDQLYSVFPAGDAHFRLLKYWAQLEAIRMKDIDAARKVWGEITRHHKNRASAWLLSSSFEVQFGTLNRAKGLLVQAYRTITDDPNAILVAWEDFERLHGDLKSNQQASAEIHSAQIRQANRENQTAIKQAEIQAHDEAKKERARAKDRANKARKRGSKRKRPSKDAAPGQMEVDSEDDGDKSHKIKRSDELGTTLFVCNFAPEVDCARLRSLFEKFGQVKEVRKPNSTVGVTRNFAYVEFSTPEEAKNALELNGHVLDREMILSVKLSDPSQRKSRPTGDNAAPSAKRLFVANLPVSMAQNSSVLSLFGPYGAIDFVRTFTDKSGAPNGRAIVEFSQEESGYAALALNSTLLEGKVITVCIADPTARKSRPLDHRTDGAPSGPLPHPSAQTSSIPPKSDAPSQASFKPRQVAHVKRPHNRLDIKAAAPAPANQTNQPSKSNQDFRNLLLGKKN